MLQAQEYLQIAWEIFACGERDVGIRRKIEKLKILGQLANALRRDFLVLGELKASERFWEEIHASVANVASKGQFECLEPRRQKPQALVCNVLASINVQMFECLGEVGKSLIGEIGREGQVEGDEEGRKLGQTEICDLVVEAQVQVGEMLGQRVKIGVGPVLVVGQVNVLCVDEAAHKGRWNVL